MTLIPTDPPCAFDPLSVVGLRALPRRYGNWRSVLEWGTAGPALVEERAEGSRPDATVRAFLLAFAIHAIAPSEDSGTSVDTVYRNRQLAGSVVDVTEGWTAIELAERLPELRRRLGLAKEAGGAGLGPDRVSRAMSLVRSAFRCRVHLNGGQVPAHEVVDPAPPRSPRESLRARTFHALIEEAEHPSERVKLAILASTGSLPCEVDALQETDFVNRVHRVSSRGRGWKSDQRIYWVRLNCGVVRYLECRWYPLPSWVGELIEKSLHDRSFPGLFAPDTPSVTATLRRVRKKVDGAEGVTATSIRLLWQAVARRAGLNHEVVRASWSQPRKVGEPRPDKSHRTYAQLLSLALKWTELDCEVTRGLIDESVVVPRRAPKGCPPDAPEVGWTRKKGPPPLPDSLRIRARRPDGPGGPRSR
jgi:hypothetical protein